MTHIAIVYFSARNGHTKLLADDVALGATENGATATIMDVARIDWKALEKADAIVFGTPTYMGSVAAEFKTFMDASSEKSWMEHKWKDKLAAGFTCSHGLSGDKLNVLVQLSIFAAQHGMLWVSLGEPQTGATHADINRLGSFLGAMAQADSTMTPPIPPEGDRRTAQLLGKRVAMFAKKMK